MTRVLLFVIMVMAITALSRPAAPRQLPLDIKAEGKAAIHILRANEDGEAVGEAVTSPLFGFRIEEGHLDQAGILDCVQQTEIRQKANVDYPVVVLKCGDLKLALVGVDLTVKGR